MSNPFVKVVKSQQERDALIAAAKKEWDALPASVSHVVCSDEQTFLSNFASTIEVEKAFVEPRPATAEERASLTGQLLLAQIMGNDRADAFHQREAGTGCAAIDAAWAEKEREEFEKLIGAPARHHENAVQAMIRQAVEKAASNCGVVVNEHDRSRFAIMPALAARASEDAPGSTLARFLTAYVTGDVRTQREVARELASAAA
jgi:hypothetical protein